MVKKKIAVLGAGPAGLMAAWRLIKEGHEVTLLEREDRAGGFGASIEKDGFILDFGPHAMHEKKSRVIPIVKSYFKEDLLENTRNIRTLAQGKYLKYPFEFYNIITQLNPFFVIRMIFDFLMASLIYTFIHVSDDSFESWGIKRFGKTLYNFCFGKYTEKVWGMPARLISPKFASRKIKGLDFKSIVSKVLGGKGEEQEIYWEKMLYPSKGSGEVFDRIAKDLKQKGCKIEYNCDVIGLSSRQDKITSVEYRRKEQTHSMEVDAVISTIPLRKVMSMMTPSFGDYIVYTAKRLKLRALILVYLVMDVQRVCDAHWIYLLDQTFTFSRLTEQKNLSKATCPDGKTMLCFEMCCNPSDDIWQYPDEKYKEMVLKDIENIKIINPEQIKDCFVIKKEEAYAVCHQNYEQHVKDLLEHVSKVPNLLVTGRQGLYLQNDMNDSMELGLSAAEFFIDEQKDVLRWYKEKTEFLDWDR